jgi:hypothetical protein
MTIRSAFQQFWAACFDAIREHDPKLITPDMAVLESAIRLIIARSEGKAPAWEGLRVVRERRK